MGRSGGGRVDKGDGEYFKNWDQIINVSMIGHESAEDTGAGGPGSILP